jgi:hypothetical protein
MKGPLALGDKGRGVCRVIRVPFAVSPSVVVHSAGACGVGEERPAWSPVSPENPKMSSQLMLLFLSFVSEKAFS